MDIGDLFYSNTRYHINTRNITCLELNTIDHHQCIRSVNNVLQASLGWRFHQRGEGPRTHTNTDFSLNLIREPFCQELLGGFHLCSSRGLFVYATCMRNDKMESLWGPHPPWAFCCSPWLPSEGPCSMPPQRRLNYSTGDSYELVEGHCAQRPQGSVRPDQLRKNGALNFDPACPS